MISDILDIASIYIIRGICYEINLSIVFMPLSMIEQKINRNTIYRFCGTRYDRIKILLKEF